MYSNVKTEPCKDKLVITTSTFPVDFSDGSPRFVFDLCSRLSRDNNITVICPSTSKIPPIAKTQFGFPVVRFRYFFKKLEILANSEAILDTLKNRPICYLLVPLFLISQAISLLKTLLYGKTVINAHWIIPQGLIAVACKKIFPKGKISVITSAHGADLFALKRFNWLKSWTINNSDKTFVVSKAMKGYCLNTLKVKNPDNIFVVPMGVDTEVFYENLNNKYKRQRTEILFVGRLSSKKGVDVLINAVALLKNVVPNIRATVVGDGNERRKLRDIARRLGVEHNVIFLGAKDHHEVAKLMNEHKTFVFPSRTTTSGDREGLGLTAIEAMACGCLVIASDLSTTEDYLIDEVTGMLFEQNNARDLADKIYHSITNPEISNRISLNGRRHAIKKFSWEATTKIYQKVIDEQFKK